MWGPFDEGRKPASEHEGAGSVALTSCRSHDTICENPKPDHFTSGAKAIPLEFRLLWFKSTRSWIYSYRHGYGSNMGYHFPVKSEEEEGTQLTGGLKRPHVT